MRNLFLLLYAVFILGAACSSKSEADRIIDRSISAHGGKEFERAKISFDFRDRHYTIFKGLNSFEYIREFRDSIGLVKDVLNNNGFTREVNGLKVDLESKDSIAYTNSVNSVAYFTFLPYGLNDAAVMKTYLGKTEINQKTFHVVKVTFSQDGGGEDFEDEFIYWIDTENYLIAYMAYSYHTDGGGVRFREGIKQHRLSGLILLDYLNYKAVDKNTPVDQMEELYKAGKLELLSEIKFSSINVEFID